MQESTFSLDKNSVHDVFNIHHISTIWLKYASNICKTRVKFEMMDSLCSNVGKWSKHRGENCSRMP